MLSRVKYFWQFPLTTPTENPFSAAQRFLERNGLPLTYIDQVVQFIEKNTSGVNLGSNNEYVDPFTGKHADHSCRYPIIYHGIGASRYQSSASSVPTGPASSYVDPYTGTPNSPHSNTVIDCEIGTSRYQSSAGSAPANSASSYVDPYTGASRYSGAPQDAVSVPPFQPVVSGIGFK